MPTKFTNHGYQDLRDYVQNNWNFIAVVDDTGTEILRWKVDNHSNTSWSSSPVSNPLTAELTITGQDIIDEGHSLPVTLVRTETYEKSGSTARTSYDPFTNVDVQVQNDEVLVQHNYRIPP